MPIYELRYVLIKKGKNGETLYFKGFHPFIVGDYMVEVKVVEPLFTTDMRKAKVYKTEAGARKVFYNTDFQDEIRKNDTHIYAYVEVL